MKNVFSLLHIVNCDVKYVSFFSVPEFQCPQECTCKRYEEKSELRLKSLHCQLTKTKNSSSNITTSSASLQYFMERPDIFQDIQSFSLEGYTSLQNLTSSSLPLGKIKKTHSI